MRLPRCISENTTSEKTIKEANGMEEAVKSKTVPETAVNDFILSYIEEYRQYPTLRTIRSNFDEKGSLRRYGQILNKFKDEYVKIQEEELRKKGWF